MVLVKTSELSGAALNWAVAKCEADAGRTNFVISRPDLLAKGIVKPRRFSESWDEGGPIIERERLEVHLFDGEWRARSYWHDEYQIFVIAPMYEETGPTFLIAAMRCYVASKLGESVDVPDNLAQRVRRT